MILNYVYACEYVHMSAGAVQVRSIWPALEINYKLFKFRNVDARNWACELDPSFQKLSLCS